MGLTPKQEKFVQGLFKGLSQRQAYKEAGYTHEGKSDGYIDKLACELAKERKISGRLTELRDKVASENIATEIEIQEFWTSTVRSDNTDMKDRLKASELLGKNKKMFVDRVESTNDHKIEVTLSDTVKEWSK